MKRTKYLNPKMDFNPALNKFEPQMPLHKGGPKIKIDWKWLILFLIILAIISAIFILSGK